MAMHQSAEVFHSTLHLFSEKDVNRTDRTNRFYEGIDNPGLVLLHDILMTYCMYDFDLGEWRPQQDVYSTEMYAIHTAKNPLSLGFLLRYF